MNHRIAPGAVLFDLDNTLCRCAEYYEAGRHAFVEYMAGLLGGRADSHVLLDGLREIDHSLVPRLGYTPHRYTAAMVETYRHLSGTLGETPDPRVCAEIQRFGSHVVDAPYALFDGARDLLLALRSRGLPVGILTKGELTFQNQKVLRNGVAALADKIQILERDKQPGDWLALAAELGSFPIARSFVVGDSAADDIRTGKAGGFRTILIGGDGSHWFPVDHEAAASAEFAVPKIADVAPILLTAFA